MSKGKRLRRNRAFEKALIKPERTTETPKGISPEWYYIIKFLGIISMLIDHTGRLLYDLEMINHDAFSYCFMLGRMAFPLFCFELVESFHFTKNRKKHLLGIGLIAVVSELFFDIVAKADKTAFFSEKYLECQNTVFTLFFGFIMLMILNLDWDKAAGKVYKTKAGKWIFKFSLKAFVIVGFMKFSEFASLDYDIKGIILIFFLNASRNSKHTKICQALSLVFFMLTMGKAAPYCLLILCCTIPVFMAEKNVKIRGQERIAKLVKSKAVKYTGRYFYPFHLFLLSVFKAIAFYCF